MSAAVELNYQVQAYNTAKESENRIHDDTVARRFGFTGGLVPGVDVYGYMVHLPVQRWGNAWLERGTAECRFDRPVYDGEQAVVTASPDGQTLALLVTSQNQRCASGHAALPDADEQATPTIRNDPPPPEHRPPADEHSLAVGRPLNTRSLALTAPFLANYLHDLRETDPRFVRDGIAHPGLLLRLCNWALSHNVVLGPWIHVGSKCAHHSLGRVGEELMAQAVVTKNYNHKGHQFVDLDVWVLANRARPVAHVQHTAIYRPRQLAQA